MFRPQIPNCAGAEQLSSACIENTVQALSHYMGRGLKSLLRSLPCNKRVEACFWKAAVVTSGGATLTLAEEGKLRRRKSFKWRMPISVPRAAVLSLQCVPGKTGVDNLLGPAVAVSVVYVQANFSLPVLL